MQKTEQTLLGQRILLTRPAHQITALSQAISSAGGQPVELPLLEIVPEPSDTSQAALNRNLIMNLDLYSSVIFVSTNAARIGGSLIDDYWPQLPLGVNWLAIGNSTRQALLEYDIQARHNPVGYDSEALLSLPELQHFDQQKVLIIRGNGGRETLAETLRSRGAQVDYADLYRRQCPDYSDGIIESTIYAQLPSAILITSGESLHNLLQLAAGSARQFSTAQLLGCKLVVPSRRLAELATSSGFKDICVATGPDDKNMVQALLQNQDSEANQ